jgi:hypothetical protein
MKVQTPKGEKYRIRRRWLPWRRRVTKVLDWVPTPGVVGSLDDDPVSFIIGAIFLIPLLVVLAFFVGEFLLLLLLLPFIVLARSIFGTPWVIEVTHQREVVHAEEVQGWGASQQRIDDLVTAMREGDLPPGVQERVRDQVRKARNEARNKARNKTRAQVMPRVKAKLRTQDIPGTQDKPSTQVAPGIQDTPRDHVKPEVTQLET